MTSDAQPSPTTRRKPVIGLTGGIGSGKSLVAHQFRAMGCGVIDADKLAQRALDDPVVQDALVEWLGPLTLNPDGKINRKRVAAVVFDDAQQLDRLEQMVHPLVLQERQRLRQEYEQDADIVAIVEDCPLLLEKEIDQNCDHVIFVEAAKDIRIQRLATARGWNEQELVRRERYQMGLDLKRKRANYIIHNDAGESDCLRHVRRTLSQILESHPESLGGSESVGTVMKQDDS